MSVKTSKRLDIPTLIASARRQLKEVTGLEACSTVEVGRTEEGWRVVMEMVERRAVPDSMDLLASYEVQLDPEGSLLEFNRLCLRRRMETAHIAL